MEGGGWHEDRGSEKNKVHPEKGLDVLMVQLGNYEYQYQSLMSGLLDAKQQPHAMIKGVIILI
jgi:hypothetical protein